MKKTRIKERESDAPVKSIKSNKKIKKLKKLLEDKIENTELIKWKPKDEDVVKTEVMKPHRRLDEFNPKQYLHDELVGIADLLGLAKRVYQDLPDGENASSLTMLLREFRGFVGDLYTITQEDKDNIFKRMDKEIIQPFFRNLVRALVVELASTKGQIIEAVGSERGEMVDTAIRTTVRNLRPIFTSQYTELMQEVSKLLGVKTEISQLVDKIDTILKN